GAGVYERVEHKLYRFRQRHEKTGHLGIGDRQRLPALQLAQEQRDNRTARRHHVSIPRCREHGLRRVAQTCLGYHDLFHHRLGHPHRIDRVDGLVGAEQHAALDGVRDGGAHYVLRTYDVGPHRFHRVELARRDLFECRGMEHVVDVAQRVMNAVVFTHVTDVELQLVVLVGDAHVLLFLFIAAEYADLRQLRIQKVLKDRVAERTRTASDEQDLVFEHGCVWVGGG